MLNKWADGFSDAQIKERQTGEMYQRELRAELAQSKKEAEQAKLEVLTLMERDRWIGQKCKYYDFDTAKYIEAKFIALSFSSVDREPIVQAEGRMPVFTTWNSVKGLPELEIKAAFNTLTSTAESAAKHKAEIEAKVLEEAATKWLPHMKNRDMQASINQTTHNRAVDDCIKHILSMATERKV
jgi:hypothetical protein